MARTGTVLAAVWGLVSALLFVFLSQFVLESWPVRVGLGLAVGIVVWGLMRAAYRRGEQAQRRH